MPRPMHRSRSKKRKTNQVPGGKVVTQFMKKRPKRVRCTACGTLLSGVVRKKSNMLTRISKTKKRPGRPYAGQLCHRCISARIRVAVRGT